jgi:hypothetical protein
VLKTGDNVPGRIEYLEHMKQIKKQLAPLSMQAVKQIKMSMPEIRL